MSFLLKKWPKNGQNGYFWPKMPEKLSFYPKNDVCTQIPYKELTEENFCRFSENIFRIARHFLMLFLDVIISRSTAFQRLTLYFLSRKTVALHATVWCRHLKRCSFRFMGPWKLLVENVEFLWSSFESRYLDKKAFSTVKLDFLA